MSNNNVSGNENRAALSDVLQALQQEEVIAYPTEAVFGLGCDPDSEKAVNALLALKQRPWQKGLILIAAVIAHKVNHAQTAQPIE